MSLKIKNIPIKPKEWSLFLDRDGVLNRRIPDDYVKTPEEFVFLQGVPEALAIFNPFFNRIVLVTNQQGIGKKQMTEETLQQIHQKMLATITASGGRIDKIYFCPALESEKSFDRKPNIGMALKAHKDFPEIHFKKSIMVGDTRNDMLFGKRAGMLTVLVTTDLEEIRKCDEIADICFPDLISLAERVSIES